LMWRSGGTRLIVGKSIPWRASNSTPKRFGFVQTCDTKPGGADNLRALQVYLNLHAEHVLDWFHIAMRLTVLKGYAKGAARYRREVAEKIQEVLEHIRDGTDGMAISTKRCGG
jgi:hypothetical protein